LARASRNAGRVGSDTPEGWQGWDEYAAFYDWENRRTVGRRDVPFWQRLAAEAEGGVLELGCGTGRVLVPLGRTAAHHVTGIDRSRPMLGRCRRRIRRAGLRRVSLIRGDIRRLPFQPGPLFRLIAAPYGILQSLLREADLRATLASAAGVLAPGGRFVADLVPDLPRWAEYDRRIALRGPRGAGGARVTLVESVRQDRQRRLTIFDQEFIEQRDRRRTVRTFSLAFRTLSVAQMVRRLDAAGLEMEAVLGDYGGGPWDPRADVWVLVARKPIPRRIPRV
jgi:SAM-dependent methyltransferase